MTPRNRRIAGSQPALDEAVSAANAERASSPPSAPSAPAHKASVARTVSPRTRRVVNAVRAVLGAALVLGLSVTVAWGARRHVLGSPRFAIDDVAVQGTHHRTPDVLLAEAGITKGMNVFALDLDRARAKLLADPWIETATVARHLPGKVMVSVTERELGGIVALPEAYLVARDGRIFKRVEVGDPVDLPIITGITSEAVAADKDGAQRTLVRALDLAGDYDRLPLATRAPLEEIHVTNGGELTLVVGKDSVSVALGLPPFRKKLEETVRIFAELEHRGAHPTVVMLDDEARPDRVVVRTR